LADSAHRAILGDLLWQLRRLTKSLTLRKINIWRDTFEALGILFCAIILDLRHLPSPIPEGAYRALNKTA
jgi:hypothetical protein